MRDEIAVLAGPRRFNDTRESWLSRAATKLENVPFRTLKSLFYGEIDDDNHWAAIEIREAALREAKREASNLVTQLETVIRGLNATDPDFHQPTITALIGALRNMRGETIT
jgi:hypothetical protein